MNAGQTRDAFQLPVPLRGFLNLLVHLPGKDDTRTVTLVSKRRSATLYRVDDGSDSVAVKVINRLKYKDFAPHVLEEHREGQ